MRHLITEAISYLTGWRNDLRQARDFAGVLETDALAAIATEVDTERQACAELAFKARVSDEEGISRLRAALADGRIDPSEIPALRLALRHFENSRRADQQLADRLS